MMRLYKILMIAGSIFFLLQVCFAYPITPRPLRKLCIESEYIIVAEIGPSVNVNVDDCWGNSKAELHVSQVIKGQLNDWKISCFYSPNMACPAPARYPEGKTVLAFLDKNEECGGFVTHALSYGSKVLDENDLKVYLNRIDELFDILEDTDEHNREIRTVEWLVRCAEEPATRWEGAYELHKFGDFMSHYDRDTDHNYGELLTVPQRVRLLNALLRSDDIRSYGDMCVIGLLTNLQDPRLTDFLLEYLEENRLKPTLYVKDIMKMLSGIYQTEEGAELIRKYDLLYKNGESVRGEKSQVITDFINLLERSR